MLGDVIEAVGRLRITAVVHDRSQPERPDARIAVWGESLQSFVLGTPWDQPFGTFLRESGRKGETGS